MKRQIFTALSLTLLISSPLTLNAGKKKKNGGSPMTLKDFMLSNDDNGRRSASVSRVTQTSSAYASANDLPALELSFIPTADVASPATLELSSTPNSAAPTNDEFDPSNTQAQRAALLVAIAALQQTNNKGLKQTRYFHELQRQEKIEELYNSEKTHAIITKQSAQTQTFEIAPAIQPSLTHREQRFAVKYVIAQWQLSVAKKS